MAGSVTGLHVFAADVGPEPLSLLDGNFNPLATAINTLSTFSNYYVDSGAVNALAITVNAPQVCASYTDGLQVQVQVANTTTSATPTLAINGLGARTLIHSDGSSLAIGELVAGMRFTAIYDATSAEFRILSPTFTAVTLNAPTFNATVTINAVAARQSLVVNCNPSVNAIVVQDGTHTGALVTSASPGAEFQFGTISNHALVLYTNNANRLTLSNNGNVTLAAPSSGVAQTIITVGAANSALQLNAPATNTAGTLLFFDTTNSIVRAFIGSGGVITGMAVADFGIAPGTSGNVLIGRANGAAIGTSFGPNGNVTIATPSSGVAFTTNGVAGQFTAIVQASTTASQSRGLEVNAGTNSSDFCFAFNNAGNTITLAELLGNGQGFLGYNGTANTISWNAAGGVTIATPSSGTALTVNGVVLINSPANPAGNCLDVGGSTLVARFQDTAGSNKAICELNASNTGVGINANWGVTPTPLVLKMNGTICFEVTTGNALQGLGPVAAALVDMTPDKSSWTTTLSGPWVSGNNPTGTLKWERQGTQITIWCDAAITQTATIGAVLTASGVPASITPSSARSCLCYQLEDNGQTTFIGTATVNTNNTITISLALTVTGANPQRVFGNSGFSGAGVTGILAGWSITYSL